MRDVFIGIRIRHFEPWIDKHFNVLKNLSYPKDKLRIVYTLRDSVDINRIIDKIKEFRDNNNLNIEVYKEPVDRELFNLGAEMGKCIFEDWKQLIDEEYFLLLDSDIVYTPPFLIQELIRAEGDIKAPYIYIDETNIFYDTWKFRINNRMFHPFYPPGQGLLVPIELTSAGGCFLTKRDIFKEVEINNPYPTISFCLNAYYRGYRTVGLPYLIVYHENLSKYRIVHSPLDKSLGGYPIDSNYVSYFEPVKTVSDTPIEPTDEIIKYLQDQLSYLDKKVMTIAEQKYKNNPILQAEKSLKWTYNIEKFHHFYFTSDPLKIMIYYYLEPYPEWIEIEPTTVCNLRCKMCEHTYWKEPGKHMTFEQFKYIVDQFPSLKWIGLTGIGESLLNPDFMEMLRYVKKDPSIFIELFDPFLLTTPQILEEFVDLSIDKIYVSMDAATKETYEQQRPGSNFDRVLENIKKLDDIKKNKNKHFPMLCFHYIINKDNIKEVLDYLELIKSLDIDVYFVQFTRMLHKFPEVKDMFVEVPETLRQDITKKAKRLGLEVHFNANTPTVKPPLYQCTAYIQPFIFATGEVIPCCATNEGNAREYQKQYSMGNVFERPFKDIWYGEKFRELRRMLYSGQIHPVCRRCPLFNIRVKL